MWPSTGRHRNQPLSDPPALGPRGKNHTIDGPTPVRRRAGVGPPVGSEGLPLSQGASPRPSHRPTSHPQSLCESQPPLQRSRRWTYIRGTTQDSRIGGGIGNGLASDSMSAPAHAGTNLHRTEILAAARVFVPLRRVGCFAVTAAAGSTCCFVAAAAAAAEGAETAVPCLVIVGHFYCV